MRANLSVTTGPESKDLVERNTVKDELGITDSSQDSTIDRLVSALGSAFAGPHGVRREPWRQTYQERLQGPGGHYMMLSRWPVESVSSVTEGTSSSPTTIDSDTYSVVSGSRRDRLYRVNGWTFGGETSPRSFTDEDGPDLIYTVAYVAGWLLPGEVEKWRASRAIALGDWVRSSDLTDVLLFECTTAGTSDTTEPTWPTTAGDTVVDNSATWTARAAQELPEDIHTVALMQVVDWFRGGLQLPAGIAEKRTGDVSVKYDTAATRNGFILIPAVKAVLESYR